ncbi:MAG: UvrD-helicase domain-containing protein [Oscillospiraceae bacterium]|jgi:DNA helicase-2/ATP-dependent DNA helicase PcrA|nr:UvrD-helicase domain-containing protein [Oscillospiraceae bacterium]
MADANTAAAPPASIGHSDESAERAHLDQTLALIADETAKLEPSLEEAQRDLRQRSREAHGGYTDELGVAEIVFAFRDQNLRNMRLASRQPYFTRVDFIPASGAERGQSRSYYIGKWGVTRGETYEQIVVDWRAPVANLYYSGQVGPMKYDAPGIGDGDITVIEGELTLKRQFGIQDGKLISIFDTGIAGSDAYLQSVLGEARGDRLREVVTSLQAEQNEVIRSPLDKCLIVQGAAGAGKTTIALHRVAYLLYAHRQRLQPKHVLILAPNPMFLNYIAAVLPDLGVEQVAQTTFDEFACALLGKKAPAMVYPHETDDPLALEQEMDKWVEKSLSFHGSTRFAELLQIYMDYLEPRVLPRMDVLFGPATLYTYERLQEIFLTELSPFPLSRRLDEIEKYIKKQLKPALERVREVLDETCAQRAAKLSMMMPDCPERQEMMRKLYASRDQRLMEAKERSKTFWKTLRASWPVLDPIAVYSDFLKSHDLKDASDAYVMPMSYNERKMFAAISERTLPLLKQKRAYSADLAPLLAIERRVTGLPKFEARHIVIDEAQDASPFQFWILREALGHDSFTIVGDLNQGIRTRQGLRDWQTLQDKVFAKRAVMRGLTVSYRNTIETMRLANHIASAFPIPGVELARPVPRRGPEPVFKELKPVDSLSVFIQPIVNQLRADGYHSIALVERTFARAKSLHETLPGSMNARLLDARKDAYDNGLVVVSAAHTKGLEFDAVIICDASEKWYQTDAYHARLLYVCVTRALHRLYVFWRGERSRLLAWQA